MLDQAKRQAGWWKPFQRLCGDARRAATGRQQRDVIFSNLCLQWVDDLPAVFAGFRRVLKPAACCCVSPTFGPDTLVELNEAFAAADDRPHVSRFAQIAQFAMR